MSMLLEEEAACPDSACRRQALLKENTALVQYEQVWSRGLQDTQFKSHLEALMAASMSSTPASTSGLLAMMPTVSPPSRAKPLMTLRA
jgi:hypothetical protein